MNNIGLAGLLGLRGARAGERGPAGPPGPAGPGQILTILLEDLDTVETFPNTSGVLEGRDLTLDLSGVEGIGALRAAGHRFSLLGLKVRGVDGGPEPKVSGPTVYAVNGPWDELSGITEDENPIHQLDVRCVYWTASGSTPAGIDLEVTLLVLPPAVGTDEVVFTPDFG